MTTTTRLFGACPAGIARQSAGPRQSDGSRRRRTIEATALVGVWVTAGYLLPLSSNGYLLLGIPLTLAFQVLVRRRRCARCSPAP